MNACQAVELGGVVRVAGRVEDGWVSLRVEDDGPGIAPEVADHLFDAFETTKPAGLGTGLGLFISRRLVEEAGGTVTLDPGHRQGAAFVIRLPAAPRSEDKPTLTPLGLVVRTATMTDHAGATPSVTERAIG